MRTGLTLSLVLLSLVMVLGVFSEKMMISVSTRYVSASEELVALVESGDWYRANETVQAYVVRWEETEKWLQILANHEDTDAVTLSLKQIAAGVRAKDLSTCLEACGELRENALHIYHRDAFTMGNVL